jgi:hypothetical protein
MRYIVTGVAQICIYSQWTERAVRVEVRGADAGAAKDLALELEKRNAERLDPHATVQWHTPALVQVQPIF